jgi:hypothetical protein
MNTANLQLEGLLMAVAEINRLLVAKGVLSKDEIATALRRAEASLNAEDKSAELRSANRDAIAFPVRLLQLANNWRSDDDLPEFSALAKLVGETKAPYNDRR